MMLCLVDLFKGDDGNVIRVDKVGNEIRSEAGDECLTSCDKLLLIYREEARTLAKGNQVTYVH